MQFAAITAFEGHADIESYIEKCTEIHRRRELPEEPLAVLQPARRVDLDLLREDPAQ